MLLQGLNSLQREPSIELMQTASVGRLIFTEQALPVVQLVDFRWWSGDAVIRITEVTDSIELAAMFPRPSVGGRHDYFVLVRAEKVSGRRFE